MSRASSSLLHGVKAEVAAEEGRPESNEHVVGGVEESPCVSIDKEARIQTAAPRSCPCPRSLGADPGNVSSNDVDSVPLQELGEEPGAATGVEDVLAGREKVQHELKPRVVDLTLLRVGPVIVVVGADIHFTRS